MTSPRRRPSAPLVISLVALVLAVLSGPLSGAVAQAAGKITGKQIASNAITSPKIKNGSILGKDLKPGTVTGGQVKDGSLTGSDLAPGTIPDASTAYSNSVSGNFPVQTSSADIVTAAVPAGSYAVIGTVSLTNISGATQDAFCTLTDGTSTLGSQRAFDIAAQRSSALTVTGVTTLASAGTISLQCRAGTVGTVFVASQSRPGILITSVGSASDLST